MAFPKSTNCNRVLGPVFYMYIYISFLERTVFEFPSSASLLYTPTSFKYKSTIHWPSSGTSFENLCAAHLLEANSLPYYEKLI